jgi:hypothetical protein
MYKSKVQIMNQQQNKPARREYEQSGLYPKNGKPFRVIGLLGVIFAVIVALAGISALVDMLIAY